MEDDSEEQFIVWVWKRATGDFNLRQGLHHREGLKPLAGTAEVGLRFLPF